SASMRTYCSAYSGFPPARTKRSSRTPADKTAPSLRPVISCAVSSSLSGASESVVALRAPPAHDARRSYSSGRAVQTTSSGTPLTQSTRYAMKSRSWSSAQCTSSNTSASGYYSAIASKNRRQAVKASLWPSPPPWVSLVKPARARRCPSTQPQSDASVITDETALCSFASTCSAGSVSRMPDCALTISVSAQWVTPAPYGNDRPWRQTTSSSGSSLTRRNSSATS